MVSAYCNKILQNNSRLGNRPTMLKFRNQTTEEIIKRLLPHYKLSSQGTEAHSNKMFIRKVNLTLNNESKSKHNRSSPKHSDMPTFREVAVFAAVQILKCNDNPTCLKNLDPHLLPQNIACNPCRIKFDAIMKVSCQSE